MGLKILCRLPKAAGLARRSEGFAQAGRRAQKKSPALRMEDWGFNPLTPFTVLSSKT